MENSYNGFSEEARRFAAQLDEQWSGPNARAGENNVEDGSQPQDLDLHPGLFVKRKARRSSDDAHPSWLNKFGQGTPLKVSALGIVLIEQVLRQLTTDTTRRTRETRFVTPLTISGKFCLQEFSAVSTPPATRKRKWLGFPNVLHNKLLRHLIPIVVSVLVLWSIASNAAVVKVAHFMHSNCKETSY